MPRIQLSDVSNPGIRNLIHRIDHFRGADHNGAVNTREANSAVGRLKRSASFREEVVRTLGTIPTSGSQLLNLMTQGMRAGSGVGVGNKRKRDAVPSISLTSAKRRRVNGYLLGSNERGKEVVLNYDGKVAIDGKVYRSSGAYSRACGDAALLASNLNASVLGKAQLRGFISGLGEELNKTGWGENSKRSYCAALTLLMRTARTIRGPENADVKEACLDLILEGLSNQDDREIQMFYLGALLNLHIRLSSDQNVRLKEIQSVAMPTHPPVEEYTKNRTKPLNVYITFHEEFWKEEMDFFKKSNGWELVKKNAKDTHREYKATFKDPSGRKAPLQVRVTIDQGEYDFLEKMSDPNAHLLIYNGHSSVGGNGSQAVAEAGRSRGVPKTVFVSNCRGKDNYAEFVEKYPEAMLITTRDPTYGDEDHRRMSALFEMFARGESFKFMRDKIQFRLWDEPKDNYFFPDEPRGLLYSDRDNDGRIDMSPLDSDPYYDVDGRPHASEFIRAINFVNSEYHYHWEVDNENGVRAVYGKPYADSVVADGILAEPWENEVVRVNPEIGKDSQGKKKTYFKVQYNPEFETGNRDHYAGVIMAHTAMEISKYKYGKLKKFEIMRSILMGFQAVHYLNVYEENEPRAYNGYLKSMGLGQVKYADMERLIKDYDTHGNNEQTKAFIKLLSTKYKVKIANFSVPGQESAGTA